MERLFSTPTFVDFGPNYLLPFAAAAAVQMIEGARPAVLRGRLRQLCPRKPGIYGMFNPRGDLIYIGKAKNLRQRLLSYFRTRSRDRKAGRIMANTVRIAWEISSSEFAALHRELELIRRWRPRFNVQGQPDGHRPTYVCVGRLPAPYVFLARKPPRDVLAWYGPIRSSRRAGEAVRRLNDWFRLRDCSQAQELTFTDQGELFPIVRSPGCLRYEIGTCLGPCIAACSRPEYFAQLQALQAFLEGRDVSLLESLQRDMASAANQQMFERAAALRDKLEALVWLQEQLQRTRELRASGSFLYPLTGHDEQTIWYLIHLGQTVAAVPAPRDETSRQQTARLIEAICSGREQPSTADQRLSQRDSVLLVAAWFRRYPAERQRLLAPEAALLPGTSDLR